MLRIIVASKWAKMWPGHLRRLGVPNGQNSRPLLAWFPEAANLSGLNLYVAKNED